MELRIIVAVLLITPLIAYGNTEELGICNAGEYASRNGQFSEAVELLTICLSYSAVPDKKKASAYQARAWAYFNLNSVESAVQDQEAAFSIKAPNQYHEFINYGVYLKKAERYKESLVPFYSAAEIDKDSGQSSMMTQYHIGWSLHELGKYEKAIDELNKGILHQSDFPFVYWRRGLSYDALGMSEKAKNDLKKYKSLLKNSRMEIPSEYQEEIDTLLIKYNLHK